MLSDPAELRVLREWPVWRLSQACKSRGQRPGRPEPPTPRRGSRNPAEACSRRTVGRLVNCSEQRQPASGPCDPARRTASCPAYSPTCSPSNGSPRNPARRVKNMKPRRPSGHQAGRPKTRSLARAEPCLFSEKEPSHAVGRHDGCVNIFCGYGKRHVVEGVGVGCGRLGDLHYLFFGNLGDAQLS